ncbi:pyrimidine dimer DNA glycosylase [Mariprofundus micogutta]|uniref:Pyrimidine dimer DNA glycosylase n=1 Tax=Mariprofundus micogutta TaxID=1921010 RepID=A0A1L8CQ10_9PROT|nr:DUF1722 domain-containing protein [Mariprofundus micogutta]GAV21016.1 pyrimidine dimer DNA glycosylase [Mariprofundus micogutta]
MRIWDVHPGYLARQQLLGEHRELHGLFNILDQGKKAYSKHPETVRWIGHIPALLLRHSLLVSEMLLRGYQHHSDLSQTNTEIIWPEQYIDAPANQFVLLASKYKADKRSGRIPLPANTQQLWAQHKYSVMAIDPQGCREIGPEVAHGCFRDDMHALTLILVDIVRQKPQSGRLMNALLHMWGYVNDQGKAMPHNPEQLLQEIQRRSVMQDKQYLLHSTALCDLALWV